MKSLVSVVTALLFALHASLCAAASVQVLSMKGSVTGRAEGAAETFLKEGDVIGSKWMVTTGRDSNVVLRFDDGQLVALQSSSTFRIDSYEYDKISPSANRVWVSLLTGGLRAITGLVANTNRSAFTLRTSTATIGVRGTELMTVYFQGLYTQVVDGIVAVSTVAGTESASAGQTVLVTSSTAAPVTVDPGAFPEGLFYELRGIQMPAPVAKAGGGAVTAGGAATGAGAAVGGASSGNITALAVFGILGAALIAIGASGDNGSSSTTATTHH